MEVSRIFMKYVCTYFVVRTCNVYGRSAGVLGVCSSGVRAPPIISLLVPERQSESVVVSKGLRTLSRRDLQFFLFFNF